MVSHTFPNLHKEVAFSLGRGRYSSLPLCWRWQGPWVCCLLVGSGVGGEAKRNMSSTQSCSDEAVISTSRWWMCKLGCLGGSHSRLQVQCTSVQVHSRMHVCTLSHADSDFSQVTFTLSSLGNLLLGSFHLSAGSWGATPTKGGGNLDSVWVSPAEI